MRRLPIDTSTFARLRKLDYLYVDKTEYMYNMIMGGHRFFLSRPRRFGKSLLVSTLKEILTGNKPLFGDLWIGNSDYHWKEYGVITFDFSTLAASTVEVFQEGLQRELRAIAQSYQITINPALVEPNFILKDLVLALYKRFGHVAILVDEYDSSILKTLHNEELAKAIRNIIQQFFTTIKGLDAEVQFVFITGVSSFVKAGIFSGINNLQILTLQEKYAAICGYTDQEIDHYFTDYIQAWAEKNKMSYDELRQQIKAWYNGYRFGEDAISVYNPFSFMNALLLQKFKNFWFQSGTPTFLVELLKKKQSVFLEGTELTATEEFLGIFDVDTIPVISLMFQAGYLTIVGYDAESNLYILDYPNLEVRTAFQKYLLEVFARIDSFTADQLSSKLRVTLINEKIDDAIELIKQLFAHVPYQLHIKQEKFYHALLMMVCVGTGIKAQSEYSTSHGRIDLVLEFANILYVIEIKFNESAEDALAQIEKRRYYERFLNQGKLIILLGLSFERKPHEFNVAYVMKKISS